MKIFISLFLIVGIEIAVASEYNNSKDSLLHLLKNSHNDTTRIKILSKLSTITFISNDSTLNFAKQAVSLAEKTKSNEWITKAYVTYGMWYYNHSNPDTSNIIWHRLYERMHEANYLPGKATAYRYIGKAFLFNSIDSAIYYNLKAIELFKQLKDSAVVNSIKINLAVVYAQSGKIDEGIRLTKEGLEYADRIGNFHDAGTAAINIAYFYEALGQYDSAAVYARKCISYNIERGDPVGAGHAKAKLADILFGKKYYEEAEQTYKEVIIEGETIKSDRLLNYGYEGIANVFLAKREWVKAIDNFKTSYQSSGKTQLDQALLYENLYKAYEGKGDYKQALNYYIQSKASRDSFDNAERLQRTDELEAKYQNKEKQIQIELLNKEKEVQQAESQRQLLIRNVIIGSSILLIMLGGLLFNRFKLKKKIENQQAIINERKRISRDLHDDLGAQLSTARMFLNNLRTNAAENSNSSLLESSLDLIDSSINDLRKIMDELQTSTLQEKGYVAATEELVNKINHLQQINFILTHHGFEKRLNHKTEHNLFRITQELVNNTLKYAKAKNVSIDIVKRDDKIILMYEDDGGGFDLQNVKRGYGLNNIESRIKSLEGTVEFDTAPAKGFRTVIEIPWIYAGAKA